jgi:hypothetical protein
MDFVRLHVVSMIGTDAWTSCGTAGVSYAGGRREFGEAMARYNEDIVDFMLARRQASYSHFESLKSGKHHNDIIRLTDMLGSRDEDSSTGRSTTRTGTCLYGGYRVVQVLLRLPAILHFAAYYDDYLALGA